MLQLYARLTGDQEVAGSIHTGSATLFCGDLIMKYFLQSFSPLHWLKKVYCQFLAKECELFSTIILSFALIKEGLLSVSGERMYTTLVNHLEA